MPQPSATAVHFDQLLTNDDDSEPVAKRVEKVGEEWCVKSESGKSLGCYPTKDEAVKRLRQVEFFKRFDAAHAALHAAFDRHRYSDELAKATDRDVRKLAQAHQQLVIKAASFGLHHEPDDASPLDILTDIREANVEPTPEAMHKAAVTTNEELRYSLAPLYIPGVLDAHAEWADASQLAKAAFDLATSDDNGVWLQHRQDILAGRRTGIVSWPYPVTAEFIVPDGSFRKSKRIELPAETIYQGTIWEPWSWPLVKSGRLLGLSMGGRARRRPGAPPVVLAAFEEAADAASVAKAAGAEPAPNPEPEPKKRWFSLRKHGSHDQKVHGRSGRGTGDQGLKDILARNRYSGANAAYYEAGAKAASRGVSKKMGRPSDADSARAYDEGYAAYARYAPHLFSEGKPVRKAWFTKP